MGQGAEFVGRLALVIEFQLCHIFVGCNYISIIISSSSSITTTAIF